ncbi:MAG TPA: hypothetical protein PKL73_23785, partial [Polyangiaceae bacterium]|nr:hypothetical protein [Polyangiaceae bacterium]
AGVHRSRLLAGGSTGGGAFQILSATANFQSVSAVDGFDEEDVLSCHAENPPNWGGYVLVQPIGELDDDDGSFPRRSHEATGHSSRATSQLA